MMLSENNLYANSVPINDRGLLYGDGVWETILIKNQQALLLDEHWQRLAHGIRVLNIQGVDLAAFKQQATEAAQAHEQTVLKVIVTRGEGQRGYNPEGLNNPTCLLQCSDTPVFPESYSKEGITLGLCEKTRLAYQPLLAGFKHLNRLEQVLARSEFQDDWQEALVMDYNDSVIEGTMSNVFIIDKNNTLITPTLFGCGIEGIMRNHVLKVAQTLNIVTIERPLTILDIQYAQSVFMTNSLIGIWPVKTWGHVHYQVHPMIRQLQTIIKAVSL